MLICMKPRIVNYSQGDTIALIDDKLSEICIVLNGEVEISKSTTSGNKVIMNKVYKGEIFGEMIAFADIPDPFIDITSKTASTVMFFKVCALKNTCSNCCTHHNILISNIIEELARKAMFLNSRIQYLSIKSMRSKICTYLYGVYIKSKKTKFLIKFNRNELADFLNVSRPSMSRELGRLRDENILNFNGHEFEILNLNKLSKYVE